MFDNVVKPSKVSRNRRITGIINQRNRKLRKAEEAGLIAEERKKIAAEKREREIAAKAREFATANPNVKFKFGKNSKGQPVLKTKGPKGQFGKNVILED